MPQDLNDLFYFAHVVEHEGFSPASRALGVPKSKLSRRVCVLEERLGVRLLQRSTRHFSVTEIGQSYYPPLQGNVGGSGSGPGSGRSNACRARGVVRIRAALLSEAA